MVNATNLNEKLHERGVKVDIKELNPFIKDTGVRLTLQIAQES
jgi:hypothetical protein